MAKPYFILTAIHAGKREMIFGDYDRETVSQERRDMSDAEREGLSAFRVSRMPDDRQITIDAFLREVSG